MYCGNGSVTFPESCEGESSKKFLREVYSKKFQDHYGSSNLITDAIRDGGRCSFSDLPEFRKAVPCKRVLCIRLHNIKFFIQFFV